VIRIAVSAEAYAAIASILPPGANVGPLKLPTASGVSGCLGPLSTAWRGCAAIARAIPTSSAAGEQGRAVLKGRPALRCSQCGGKSVLTGPSWYTARRAGVPDFRPKRR
jgi:hypothetical protein